MGAGSASGGGISNTSSNSYAAVIAVSANLGPIIVWRDEAPGNSDIYVKRWNGSSWVELGSGSASGGGISANSGQSSSPAIVIGADGYPVVAWGDATPGQSEIYVKRWDGSAWVEMGAASASGGGISNTSANSYRPSLCLGPDNLPVVAWQEFISGSNYDIFIRKWNGSAWVEMGTGSASGGGVSNNTGTSELPCLRRGADGNPVVAWDDSSRGNYEVYVRRWDGSAWAAISTGSASSGGVSNNNGVSINTSLAIDGSGRPVVTWQDTLSGMTNIYVRRLESSAWVEMGTGSASGGGISNTSGYAERPCVAIGADGNPVIAWRDTSGGSGGDIYLRRWDGSSWVELPAGSASGTGISANTAGTSLLPFVARDNDGSLIVAWQDTAVGNSEIYVRHYPLPMVTVAATDPNASETGPDTGTFTVARTGDTSSAIVVGYTLSGTASNGVDYISLPGSVTMSAGNTNATVTVTPIDDALVEGNETVILTLAAGSGYTVGSPNSATVTIADNDVVYSPAPTGVDLADASDTGASNTDNITNLDNSSPSKRLTFHVTGTVSGATVKLLWNSTVIGTATASGTTTDVTTNGSTDLPDGLQTITARQTAPGEFESGDSPALAITIDTQVPAISSWVAVNIAAGGGSTQTITVTYSDGGGVSTASLGNNNIRVTGPNGYDTLASFGSVTQNGNTWTAAYTITAPGGTWDHADIGTYTIAAADTQIYDLAGNVVTGATLGTFFVADADWTIIKGAASSAMDSLAADELKKYVEQMTGKTVALITDAETPTGTNVFLVGKAATNTKIADFVSRALIAISPTNPGTEGYINKTVDDGGKHYVVLAGCDDMGAQYSVYNFLESYCKVGFLLDGDTVPHVDPLVVTNLDVSRKPFTKYRIQSVYGKGKLWYGAGTWGTFFSYENDGYKTGLKDFLDWMMRKQMNVLYLKRGSFNIGYINGYPNLSPSDIAAIEADGIWWKSDYVTAAAKQLIAYAKSRGMKTAYTCTLCRVPDCAGIRAYMSDPTHPCYGLTFEDMGSWLRLNPLDDRSYTYFLRRQVDAVIAEFGAPDFWWGYYGWSEQPLTQGLTYRTQVHAKARDLVFSQTGGTLMVYTWDWGNMFGGPPIDQEWANYKSVMPKDGSVMVMVNQSPIPSDLLNDPQGPFAGYPWLKSLTTTSDDQSLPETFVWWTSLTAAYNAWKTVLQQTAANPPCGFSVDNMIHHVDQRLTDFECGQSIAGNANTITLDQYLADYTLRAYGTNSTALFTAHQLWASQHKLTIAQVEQYFVPEWFSLKSNIVYRTDLTEGLAYDAGNYDKCALLHNKWIYSNQFTTDWAATNIPTSAWVPGGQSLWLAQFHFASAMTYENYSGNLGGIAPGTLTVRVLDQFDQPVANAHVVITRGNLTKITGQATFDLQTDGQGQVSAMVMPDIYEMTVPGTSAAVATLMLHARDKSVTLQVETGSLQVTISPQGAIDAGAQWRVDSGAWQNSGATVSGLVIGDHMVQFKLVAGWDTPATQTATISDGQTTLAEGIYFLDNQGTLQIVAGTNYHPGVVNASGGILQQTGGEHSVGVATNFGQWTIASGLANLTNFHNMTGGTLGNGGILTMQTLVNAGTVQMTNGIFTVMGVFTNAPGGTFNFSGGSVFVALQMNNMGTFIQSGGLFDPAFYDNTGTLQITGGTNMDTVFLNEAGATALQSGGEHNVNVATNLGVWTVSGGGANLTNLFIESGGVFTNAGGALVSSNALGQGVIDVRNGALVLNSGTVMVNQFYATNFASSVVNFNGGTLHSGGSVVNNGSIFQVGDGTSAATLHLLGGAHSFANGLFINTNSWLTGTSAITGVITNAGSIAPGDSAGILTGSGDLTLLGNSLLQMQLAGTNDWLYDQVNLAGAFNFGGALTLSLLDGFNPAAGNRFDLFDFSGGSGAFSLTNLPGLDPLLYWNTSALYSTGEIEADWMTGSLQVTLAPAAAVSAGAQWQVDGGGWQNSGDTVPGLVIGDHTLAFKNAAGWIKPTNRVVQVAFGETTATNVTYELTPVLLAAASRKTHGAAGAFDLNLNLNPAVNPTVEPRRYGPTQVLFTFNKAMMAADGVLSANEFTLTNATYVSASIASSNLTLNLTNTVDQSRVTVVLNGFSDLAGNGLVGTNAVRVRALYGDANQSGTVNLADMQATKYWQNSTLTTTNALSDLNLSGTINLADIQAAKSTQTHTVPLGGFDTGAPPLQLAVMPAPVLAAATLGEVLGAPALVWSTNGDEVWTPAVAPDGSLAAWSGSVGDLNVSWVETMVSGPGTVSFEWKVSSEAGADFLTFSVDGADQPGRISGEAGWQVLAFSIPTGAHRLTWTYAKNRANACGLDAGWLRRVSYQRSP